MKFSSFKYLFKQGLSSFKDNKLMSMASVGVVTSCLIIVGVCALLAVNVNSFVSFLGSQNEVVVYIKDGFSEETINNIRAEIEGNENINDFVFVSKEEALTESMMLLGDYGQLLSGYEGENNPLPASFRCTIKKLDDLNKTSTTLASIEGVEYVSSSSELVSILITIRDVTYYSGMSIMILLVLVSLVVISNTIRLTVFARRKEINIMKYVGATNMFIRLPFIVEGLLIGVISSLVTFAFLSGGYLYLYDYITVQSTGWLNSLSNSLVPYSDIWYYLLLSFLGFGCVIGTLGSSISMKRYLGV